MLVARCDTGLIAGVIGAVVSGGGDRNGLVDLIDDRSSLESTTCIGRCRGRGLRESAIGSICRKLYSGQPQPDRRLIR
jgi:hypothetical protein